MPEPALTKRSATYEEVLDAPETVPPFDAITFDLAAL